MNRDLQRALARNRPTVMRVEQKPVPRWWILAVAGCVAVLVWMTIRPVPPLTPQQVVDLQMELAARRGVSR